MIDMNPTNIPKIPHPLPRHPSLRGRIGPIHPVVYLQKGDVEARVTLSLRAPPRPGISIGFQEEEEEEE
jgi:hypothetical protein